MKSEFKKLKKSNYYTVSYVDLLAIANKRHWIHELDELDDKKGEKIQSNKNPIDHDVIYDSDSD